MTREGFDALEKEIDRLWHEERPEVVAEVSAAAELGDRSENAAYIYGKKRLRTIDSRLRYLRRKVDGVTPVDLGAMPHTDHIRFGAIVEVEREDGEVFTWRLVDKEESEPKKGRISIQSPVGRALMKKSAGDVVEVKTPAGPTEYEVLEVRYGAGKP
ncbi:MAG: GreA/GreB family elongation factor [Deltaproteobacteria bacterium]|nr:GreA/GreB family elongation factor [Deltaproteobacteria bacterium]